MNVSTTLPRWLAPAVLAPALLVAAAGCVEELPPLQETTSLRVEVVAPTDLGSEDARLPADVDEAQITVTAIGADGQVDTGFSGDVEIYVHFLGSLTPELAAAPIRTVTVTSGVSAPTTVELPPVFGPTNLWVQDDEAGGSYPTGVSPTFWFADPFTRDLQRPRDEGGIAALSVSPLMNKQATVMGSRHGARGRLVVTGIYSQGYTVSDVLCADEAGTPPCTTDSYDHMLVFSFSRPRDERGRNVVPGQFIDGYSGAVTEFNGLTEMGFPRTFADSADSDPALANPARIPEPVTIQASWLNTRIEFERTESSLVQVVNGTVCPLDEDWETFKQWKLDVGAGCERSINVITAGVVEFDPQTRIGMQVPKVVGVLRPINIGTFNVWIMYPRDAADLTL